MLKKEQFGFNAFWWEKLWTEEDIRKCTDALAEIGYKAVEFKETSFNPDEGLEKGFKRAVKIAASSGLSVSNFVILRDIVNVQGRKKGIDDVINCIRATSEAGVNKLNLITGGMPGSAPVDDNWWRPKETSFAVAWDNVFDAFEKFLKVAEKYGVYLAVEACIGQVTHDYYSTLPLFSRFDSKFLALTFDPSHYLLYRNDIPWAIRQWKGKIKHVHLKDAVGEPGEFGLDFLFPILGEGGINWKAFLEALDEIHYDGFLCVEFESFKYMHEVLNDNPAEAARLSMLSLRNLTRGMF
jgi:sugar phosphate isomerase/epimerase